MELEIDVRPNVPVVVAVDWALAQLESLSTTKSPSVAPVNMMGVENVVTPPVKGVKVGLAMTINVDATDTQPEVTLGR